MIPGITAGAWQSQPDGPTLWNQIPDGDFPNGPATNWQMLASNGTDTVLASGLTQKFYRSTDSGITWASLALPPAETSYVRSGVWVALNRWLVIGASSNTTYYVTGNNGDSWVQKTLPYTPTGGTLFYVDQQNRSRVYARNGSSLYLSTDSGDTFSSTPLITFANTLAGLVQNGTGTLIATLNLNPASQYSISTNGGVSWGTQTALSATNVYSAGVWNGTYWVLGAANTSAPILYSATAGSGTWQTAFPNVSAWSMEYNPVDGSVVAVGDGVTTPISTRQSITTWVRSPVSGFGGLYLVSASCGNYWLALGGTGFIRAPRAR